MNYQADEPGFRKKRRGRLLNNLKENLDSIGINEKTITNLYQTQMD